MLQRPCVAGIAMCLLACGCGGGDARVGGGSSGAAGPTANLAFVTSTLHVMGALGSRDGADAICNGRAEAAGLPGAYLAVLAMGTEDALTRFEGWAGWVNTDGTPLMNTIHQLAEGRTFYPPQSDESGARVPNSFIALGGVELGEDALPLTCRDWTDTAPLGFAGSVGSGGTYLYPGSVYACATDAHLLCLGTGLHVDVTPPPTTGRRVFVSTSRFLPGGGLAAADALCAQDASAVALSGTFRAVLPTSSQSALDRVGATGTWVRTDHVVVTTSADLLAGRELRAPILFDATGHMAHQWFWSGAWDIRTPSMLASTCDDWTSNQSNMGLFGSPWETRFTSFFSDNWGRECTTNYPILCLEDAAP